jgi:hypothetical protein
MTSMAMAGRRCRSLRDILAPTRHIERFSEGRIRYGSENLGRLLLVIDWDRGGSTVLFPDEIEIIDSHATTAMAR